jgi:hypothetical protein
VICLGWPHFPSWHKVLATSEGQVHNWNREISLPADGKLWPGHDTHSSCWCWGALPARWNEVACCSRPIHCVHHSTKGQVTLATPSTKIGSIPVLWVNFQGLSKKTLQSYEIFTWNHTLFCCWHQWLPNWVLWHLRVTWVCLGYAMNF